MTRHQAEPDRSSVWLWRQPSLLMIRTSRRDVRLDEKLHESKDEMIPGAGPMREFSKYGKC